MKVHLEQAMMEFPQLSQENYGSCPGRTSGCAPGFQVPIALGVVREVTRQLNANGRGNGMSPFLSMRSLTANIWKSTASDLSLATSHRQRSVVLVALRAVIANPFMITSPGLLKVFARQTVGTRAYIALALLIDRIF